MNNQNDQSNLRIRLIRSWGDDHTAVQAARVSLGNEDQDQDEERDLRLMRFLLDHQHTSPFEHAGATFLIQCPIFSARQIMRHRTFSYNEISRRYTDQDIHCYLPRTLQHQHEKRLQCSSGEHEDSETLIEKMRAHQNASIELYRELIGKGVSREQARMVLPLNLITRFYMTGNLLNWLKFLRLRLSPESQIEARLIAQAVKLHLSAHFPETLEIAQELIFTPVIKEG